MRNDVAKNNGKSKRSGAEKNADAHNRLTAYRDKRHFEHTPEPQSNARPARAPRKSKSPAPLFVVQKHAARRLHYDFRLELGGTLKSWAIPKGPCLDPSIKRMAVHVEDHPLSYAEFEGTIPAGNYGAGTVIVWDIGTWEGDDDIESAYEKGHLRFELKGKKLHGRWHLVRTRNSSGGKESWLLIKQQDDAAKPLAQYDIVEAEPDSALTAAPDTTSAAATAATAAATRKMPAQRKKKVAPVDDIDFGESAVQPLMIAPQLATLVDTPPRGGDWIYEVKFDGYRILARTNARDGVHLFTRNGNDWTKRLKVLASAISAAKFGDAWLDGEIVMLGGNGVSNFQRLQNAFEREETKDIVFMLFDILYYHGNDLRSTPLSQRREILKRILQNQDNPLLRFSDHIDAKNEDLFDIACRMHIEGLIGKRADSIYISGRSRDWIKLKCLQRQEFVIGGYTDSSNANVRAIGALLLGVHDSEGKLRYVGKVGTGFSQQSAIELHKKLQPLTVAKSPFATGSTDKAAKQPKIPSAQQGKVHWVKPSVLAEIAFAAWTDDGHIRHSSFQGLRADKEPDAITRELPIPVEKIEQEADNTGRRKKSTVKRAAMDPKNTAGPAIKTGALSAKHSESRDRAMVADVKITHPDRIIDASSGATKLDLVLFYQRAAPQLLAHLKNRPVSLVRAPDGVGGEVFFQKHRGSLRIPALTELDPGIMPNHPPLVTVDSLDALLQCAQMNVVEFHTWNAQLAHIEQPDRIIFDLDPGEGIVWPQIIEAAQLMKTALDELHLKSFLKTSGGKGLHVVVPLSPRDDWQQVRDFSETLVRYLARTLPSLFVATSGPKNRINRIFIDYLRNNRGSTTVSAFSARLRAGLGVSVPLLWEELKDLDGSAHWHINNLENREIEQRAACWRGYARVKQTLTRASRALNALTLH